MKQVGHSFVYLIIFDSHKYPLVQISVKSGFVCEF